MGGSQVYSGGTRDEEEHEEQQAGQAQIHTEGVDELLDEIDGLLENNAEEFVRSYVQKGGQ
ncbi:ubiquitin-like protein Pup [Corynebacterium gerontici]|uniref:Prokaryotic ubiquitin-like protein Pup n=1 Tax=Corynebacterium gerontici TaxID=2079234 RepID=A0A3G6J056_9CORY|nr:ubiquitin-like protein Pup [Corynebacterium gerontici]AZA11419.1 Prokaryotic ubiquitin-like protein Pup [Corynebacterium gerontici]